MPHCTNYRVAYGIFCCTGILSNHESPLRPSRFVTKKIVKHVSEIKSGSPEFNRLRKEGSEHLIESTGKKLRSMMSWMDKEKLVANK